MFPVGDKARLVALVAELLATPDESLLAETALRADVQHGALPLEPRVFRGDHRAVFPPVFRRRFPGRKTRHQRGIVPLLPEEIRHGPRAAPGAGHRRDSAPTRRRLAAGQTAARLPGRAAAQLGGGVDGVVTEHGETIACEHLFLATDAPATARLLERPPCRPPLGTTVVYFAATSRSTNAPCSPSRRARAAGAPFRPVDQRRAGVRAARPASSQRDRARPARPGRRCRFSPPARGKSRRFIPWPPVTRPLAVVDVPYAQHRQPAGFARGCAAAPAATHFDNVWLAGDQTGACSIQSALVSGERAAAFLARRLSR